MCYDAESAPLIKLGTLFQRLAKQDAGPLESERITGTIHRKLPTKRRTSTMMD